MKYLPFLATLAIAGCASTPYAIIDGSQSQISDSDNYDVKILSIDGKLRPSKDFENIDPGFHFVNLVTTGPLKTKGSEYQLFAFEAKECTRYLVTAQHKNSVSDDWEVKLLREVPIPSCTPSEKSTKEQAVLPEYLTSAEHAVCHEVTALNNSSSPVSLYPSLKQCIIEGKQTQAFYLYMQASAYGFYDAARVYDESAQAAITQIQKHSIWTLAEPVQTEFEQALGAFIHDQAAFAKACDTLSSVGKPDYIPQYMIEHGVMKLDANSDNGLKKSFDSDSAWKSVLVQKLGCTV